MPAASATVETGRPTGKTRPDLRNVAIVAHVDHGKTTLVDAMLRQSGAFAERAELVDRVMDSGELEREKGITILAKNTSIHRQTPEGSVTINVIDTPGHADFGGEVERGLAMVDGVVLLVDASEGPLPQTRFVLRKTLEAGLPVILLVNKTDRPDARIAEVVEETHDLLLELASDIEDADHDAILDLPVVYASARAGKASLEQPADGEIPESENLDPLFDTLLRHVPPPAADLDAPLQALVTNLDASNFLGRIALIRIHAGKLRKGQTVAWMREDGTVQNVRISELLVTEALTRVPATEASAGELVAIAGIPDITIGDTLADSDNPVALPRITVDEPAISMTIGVNTSPLAGRNGGDKVTARLVKARLDQELIGNVSIRVLPTERPDTWEVQGRGELALAILVEQMRREGFELTVGKPQVVLRTIDGKLHEPFERLYIDSPEEHLGAITQLLAGAQGPHGGHERQRHRPDQAGVRAPVPRPDQLPHRLPHRDPRHRHREPRVRGLLPVGGRDPHPAQRLPGRRPHRPGHRVRDDPAGRPRHLLRRAGRRGVRGHGRGREPALRGPRHQHHQGEEADQHASVLRRRDGDAGPPAQDGPGRGAGVLLGRRVRRGRARGRPGPQGHLGRQYPREGAFAREEPRQRLIANST